MKPCPFCGKTPELLTDNGNENIPKSWTIKCVHIGCTVNPRVTRYGSSIWLMPTDETKRQDAQAGIDVIEAWNTRSP